MQTGLAITLIICGTVAGIAPLFGPRQLPDSDFYGFAAAGVMMVLSGMVGPAFHRRPRTVRGFEPLPAPAAA